jgi:hypothetical protein
MTQPPEWPRTQLTTDLPAAPKQVSQNAHFTVLVDERMGLIRTTRSDKPFASLTELEGVFTELGDTLDRLGRARFVLLADIRSAPGRNDPQFEAALQRLRPRWVGGFRKVGVLVQSATGMLQVHRYAQQDGIKRLVSNDEDEVLKYLTQGD